MPDTTDDELYAAIRTAWEDRDPVPGGLVARLQATTALAASDTDLDLELMTLVERSGELAGARGSGPNSSSYTLRFAHDGVDLLVRVDSSGGEARGARNHGARNHGARDHGARDHGARDHRDHGGDTGVGPGVEGGARIDCWLVPPTPMTVRVLLGADPDRSDGPTVAVNDAGRFEVVGLPSGLLRLRLEPHDDSPVFVTPAFEI